MSETPGPVDAQIEVSSGNGQLKQPEDDDIFIRMIRDPAISADKIQVFYEIWKDKKSEERKEQAEQARLAFFRDKALMQAEMPIVPRTMPNPNTGKNYSPLEVVWALCAEVWVKFGFSVSFDVETQTNGWLRVSCIVNHKDGHEVVYHAGDAPSDDKGIKGSVNKSVVQGNQSTVTYVKRGVLCNAMGIVTKDEDDDGNSSFRNQPMDQRQREGRQHRAVISDQQPGSWVGQVERALIGEKNAWRWMSLLIAATERARTPEDLNGLEDLPTYKATMANAPDDQRVKVKVAFGIARKRLTPKPTGPAFTAHLIDPFGVVLSEHEDAVAFARALVEVFHTTLPADVPALIENNEGAIDEARADGTAAKILEELQEPPLQEPPLQEPRAESPVWDAPTQEETAPAPKVPATSLADLEWTLQTKIYIGAIPASPEGRVTFDEWAASENHRKKLARMRKEKPDLYADLYSVLTGKNNTLPKKVEAAVNG